MPVPAIPLPAIFVSAGVNGAGKSSITGELIRTTGLQYFNPDEAAKRIRVQQSCSVEEANSLAWQEGKQHLDTAIRDRLSYAFESTLSGDTIPALLIKAAEAAIPVVIWYTGLATPEQHIARVRMRVEAGGHDIPEALIRQRWDRSQQNIVKLLPHLTELRVFDNSVERQPGSGTIPDPRLILLWRNGKVEGPDVADLRETPEWAKAIVTAALKLQRLTSTGGDAERS
jgi:predicted ABC-type ATPase